MEKCEHKRRGERRYDDGDIGYCDYCELTDKWNPNCYKCDKYESRLEYHDEIRETDYLDYPA
ncbi:MAG: hypothetical protein ACYCSQ_00180 [bacterium]